MNEYTKYVVEITLEIIITETGGLAICYLGVFLCSIQQKTFYMQGKINFHHLVFSTFARSSVLV